MGTLYSYERETMEDRIQELENEREEFEGLISDVLDCIEDSDRFEDMVDYLESVNEAVEMLKNFSRGLK